MFVNVNFRYRRFTKAWDFYRAVASSIIGGLIFIYSCTQTIKIGTQRVHVSARMQNN